MNPDTSTPGKITQRLFGVFTEVRPGEALPALLLLANIFLVLTAYYFIKPVREGWLAVSVISGLSKMELKAYSSFAQAMVLLLLIPLYARLAAHWPRRQLIARVGLFFVVNLLVFWLLHPGMLVVGIPYLGVAFYIWVGIVAVTLVAQFWSFAADLYGEERGRRLFPLIAVGGSAGAVAGSWVAEKLVQVWHIETFDLLLYATVPLALALTIAWYVDRHGVNEQHAGSKGRDLPPAADGHGAYRLIWEHDYLRLTALMVFTMFWVMTNGENILFAAVQEALADAGVADANDIKRDTAAFYSRLYFWVNLTGLLLQAFIVSRIQRYAGFGGLLLTPPLISLVSNSAMAASNTLEVISAAKTAENGSNYSINNTARQVLWLPTTREMIYKAKTAIDTLCVRFGDGLAALTVLIGTRVLQIDITRYLAFNLVLIVLWLILAILVVREHRRLSTFE